MAQTPTSAGCLELGCKAISKALDMPQGDISDVALWIKCLVIFLPVRGLFPKTSRKLRLRQLFIVEFASNNDDGSAEIVAIEKIRGEALAAAVFLTLLGIKVDFHRASIVLIFSSFHAKSIIGQAAVRRRPN
jgi:hypothetical protein